MKKVDYSVNLFARRLLFYCVVVLGYSVVVAVVVYKGLLDDWFGLMMLFVTWLLLVLFGLFDTLSQPIVQIQGHLVISHSYNKKTQCFVDLKQPVYFSVYKTKGLFTDSFLVISNEPFERYSSKKLLEDDYYYEGYLRDKQKPFFDARTVYDKKTQIRMPYNKNLAKLFSLENWIEVKVIHPWDTSYPN